ncbi:PhoH family protein [Blautia sp. An249]|uniref:PhoH family protein n=1 Tax=Blautia sp. An249 TaxID=1965603 RepID=UPI001FA90216|nr:PhoH family protein [Blautia sp. An249]
MQTEQIEFDTVDQQQAVFGMQDQFAKIIEKELNVSISLRDSRAEIKGEPGRNTKIAAEVMDSLLTLYKRGENLKEGIVYRLLEEAAEGNLDETCKAMDSVVTITQKGAPIKCKTFGQKNYVKALQDHVVTICIGPAGTGKTYLAVAQAARELKNGDIERIIMSRPAIEAGEERLGFLPGDLAQKVDPYLRPLYDALHDIFGADKAEKLRERRIIEIAPLAYMRGRTLNHARVIIDESQNASLPTLKMALTRLGEGSKMVLTGDVTQIDLPKTQDSGLEKCAEILNGIEGISITRLNNRDVVRNKIVKDIVKAFEKEEQKKQMRQEKGKTSKTSFRRKTKA